MGTRVGDAMIANSSAVLRVVDAIRQIYRANFDSSWFMIAVDRLPVDIRNLRDTSLLFQLGVLRRGDELVVTGAVHELERLAKATRKYVLPNLRDRLGVSFFTRQRGDLNEQEYLVRQFHAYTFPHNLSRLEELLAELRMLLDLDPDSSVPAAVAHAVRA